MTRHTLTLKKLSNKGWALFGPKGNQISEIHRGGDAESALEWAKRWVSSWYNFDVEMETNDEKKD